MRHPTRVIAILAACCLGAACSNSTGSNGGLTAVATDSVADTYGTAGNKQWDFTSMKIVRDTGGITVTLAFTTNVILSPSGDTTALVGAVEFDVDQSTATGDPALVDAFRPGAGATGMGVDYILDLFDVQADSTAPVVDSTVSVLEGYVKITVSGNTMSARIPRAMLGGDDGYLNAAALVGTQSEPTDIVPNNGHLHVGGTGTDIVSAQRVGPTAVPGPIAMRWRARARRPH